jgi:hypothetical protein
MPLVKDGPNFVKAILATNNKIPYKPPKPLTKASTAVIISAKASVIEIIKSFGIKSVYKPSNEAFTLLEAAAQLSSYMSA